MKRAFYLFYTAVSVSIIGCQNSEESNTTDRTARSENLINVKIQGAWTLTDELYKGKSVKWEGRPISPEMIFKENGYYLYVDRITDKKMKSDGISTIQERYKGQFYLNGNNLIMHHYISDSLVTKRFKVEKLNATELVINDTEHVHTMFLERQF